jgi:hypothetical protein
LLHTSQTLIAYLFTGISISLAIKMILSILLLPSLALSALGQGFTPAPVTTNNPPTTYNATLFDNPSTSVRGYITASGAPDGVGIIFRVNFTGLPADIGPFRKIPFLDLQSEIIHRTNAFNQLITFMSVSCQQAVIAMPLGSIWTPSIAVNNLLVTQVTLPLAKLVISVESTVLLLEMVSLPSTQTSICLLIPVAMLSSAISPSSFMMPVVHA